MHTFDTGGSPLTSSSLTRIIPATSTPLPALSVTSPFSLVTALVTGLLPGHTYRLMAEVSNSQGSVSATLELTSPNVAGPPPPSPVAMTGSPAPGKLRLNVTVLAGLFGVPTGLVVQSRLPFTPILQQTLHNPNLAHGQVVVWDVDVPAGTYVTGQLMVKARIWDHKNFISRATDFWDSWWVPVLGGPVAVS